VLDKTSLTLSNAQDENYQKTISVAVSDQYNNPVEQTSATASIREENGKSVLAQYDRSTGQITVAAQGAASGTYTYTLTLTLGGSQLKAGFQVIVQAVPENGVETYLTETNTVLLDTKKQSANPQTFEIRIARYVNGIFGGYASLQSATVQSSLGWYGEDLTAEAKAKSQKIYPTDNKITLTAAYSPTSYTGTSATQKTAKAGTYTVTLKYYEIGENAGSKAVSKQVVLVVK
jgi:hypothetical protein